MTTTSNGKAPTQLRRRYGAEKDWLPVLVKMGHTKLRYGFMAFKVAPAVASGLVFYLEDQITLARHQSHGTRNQYRKILADLSVEEIEAWGESADNPLPDQPIMHSRGLAA